MKIMRKSVGTLGALGLGASAAYLLDPERGRRRRALIGEKAKHFWRITTRSADKKTRDLSNRAKGVMAQVKRTGKDEVSDDVLVDRVRSEMGHVVTHPGFIDVTANQGTVTLIGSVPKNELPQLLARVSAVRGVTDVRNRLSVREPAKAESAGHSGWFKPLLWSFAGTALAAYGGKRMRRHNTGRMLGT